MRKSKPKDFQLPSSKSLSNRALILNFLFPEVKISNLSQANDTLFLQEALERLRKNEKEINCGEGGTTFRFLLALAGVLNKKVCLKAEGKMKERPVSALVEALKSMGADIRYKGIKGCPPVQISPQKINTDQVSINPSVSSQFVTALMLVAPYISKTFQIKFTQAPVSFSYLKMTQGFMEKMGVEVKVSQEGVQVHCKKTPQGLYKVEADWSSASYAYLCCLALDKELFLPDLSLDSLQGDAGIVPVFSDLGVGSKPVDGGIYIFKGQKQTNKLRVDCEQMPDMAMSFIMGAVLCEIGGEFTGLETLPKKESQRIAAMHQLIEQLGGKCWSDDKSLKFEAFEWDKKSQITIDTHKDHRILMVAAVLKKINPLICFSEELSHVKSFPNFWNELERVAE